MYLQAGLVVLQQKLQLATLTVRTPYQSLTHKFKLLFFNNLITLLQTSKAVCNTTKRQHIRYNNDRIVGFGDLKNTTLVLIIFIFIEESTL